jgi:hypothetical protein
VKALFNVKILLARDQYLRKLERSMRNFNPLLWRKPHVSWIIGIAVVSVAAALLISRRPSLHLQRAPGSLFFCAVTISAWFDGTGRGLRISRSNIEWHGNRLWAADQSPSGVSSYLTLPIIIEIGAR